ncbi:MAG: hypothetical protein RIS35_2058 [Pseudomonadota bacterium]|jgi:uncharacterized lipoprotein YmbA
MRPPPDDRPASTRASRRLALAATLALAAGCASRAPATDWVRLPIDVPAPLAGTLADAADRSVAKAAVWQLVLPIELPGHLDRDAVIAARDPSGLTALTGARWAEPLRDAVPRVLRSDLARLLDAEVWTVPLPPGVVPTRQIRVTIDALDAMPDGRRAELRARWSIADPHGASAPFTGTSMIVVAAPPADGLPGPSGEAPDDAGGGQADAPRVSRARALAAAYREALARLALRIALGTREAAGRTGR